ncbi:MAG: hypothetical protein COT18_11945 [Elusimicrobia bacterium CG08_land_8_20_14_0_20_59_10]|nr:MAG: hypothetical protein COT18_11945 [Elusimicrobia bacterium CG08_land_8_20_14_0_20_59_10]
MLHFISDKTRREARRRAPYNGPLSQKTWRRLSKKTYDAVPDPKVVIAVGDCAVSGGIYADREQTAGIPPDIKADLFIPGCPPHPLTILDGLLRLIGKIR